MGEKVLPHDTPMVSGSIEDESLSVDLAEHADSYVISISELSLCDEKGPIHFREEWQGDDYSLSVVNASTTATAFSVGVPG